MTFSISSCPVAIQYIGDAQDVYGSNGLLPATPHSVGIDLRACLAENSPILIGPGERQRICTGIVIEPKVPNLAGFVYSRSGLGAVKGLVVAQGVGVIDPDYRGEIMVFMLNTSTEEYSIRRGERIAQIIFQPYYLPRFELSASLGETKRGQGGFGHTGK